jgi:DNA-binding CsgD family transcriptional regulator
MMFCFSPLRRPGIDNAVYLLRARGDADFLPRHRAIVGELNAQVAALVDGPLAGFLEPSPAALPPRARQVLRCLLEGDGDKQVAVRLGMSRHTVNAHVRRIFAHFGVTTRSELMARWIRRGWSPGPHDPELALDRRRISVSGRFDAR